LATQPLVVLEGDGSFRRFLAEAEAEHGVRLEVAAECTSHLQVVDLAEAAGWAVFVPEWWWQRNGNWKRRTQELPGLEDYRHVLQIGWNERVAKRREEVRRLVEQLGGMR
jgi:DNA-binding transcriptional LysR family regulator